MGLFKSLFSLFTSSADNAVSEHTNNFNKVETNPPTVEEPANILEKNSDGMISKYVFRGEIKSGTPISVSSDEIVIVTKDGKIVEVLPTGVYAINESSLSNFIDGVTYTFKLSQSDKIRWGTNKPIVFSDSKYGMLSLRVCGDYYYQICDPVKIFDECLNGKISLSFNEHTRNLVINAVEKVIHNYNGSSYTLLPTADICKAVKDELGETGFNFTVQIEMIKLTEESEAAIH